MSFLNKGTASLRLRALASRGIELDFCDLVLFCFVFILKVNFHFSINNSSLSYMVVL